MLTIFQTWDISHVLQSLGTIPSVSRIAIDIGHVKYHKVTAETEKQRVEHEDAIGVPLHEAEFEGFEATDLCHWTSEKWPKFMVQYSSGQYLLQFYWRSEKGE